MRLLKAEKICAVKKRSTSYRHKKLFEIFFEFYANGLSCMIPIGVYGN